MNRSVWTLTLCIALVGCGGETASNEATEATATSSPAVEQAGSEPLGSASAVGDVMPRYTANDLDEGGVWKLAEHDGATLLNLWATWCGPCRYEIPALIDLQNEYGERGLQVVGVSMDQSGMEGQIQNFARQAGINYKIVHDPRARLADVFETTIIPTTALIGPDGKIVWFHRGIVTGDDPALLQALESVLDAPATPAAGS